MEHVERTAPLEDGETALEETVESAELCARLEQGDVDGVAQTLGAALEQQYAQAEESERALMLEGVVRELTEGQVEVVSGPVEGGLIAVEQGEVRLDPEKLQERAESIYEVIYSVVEAAAIARDFYLLAAEVRNALKSETLATLEQCRERGLALTQQSVEQYVRIRSEIDAVKKAFAEAKEKQS